MHVRTARGRPMRQWQSGRPTQVPTFPVSTCLYVSRRLYGAITGSSTTVHRVMRNQAGRPGGPKFKPGCDLPGLGPTSVLVYC
jgi:hypothetical protein